LETYGANGPNITHAVNPVSKYRKHASKAFQFPLRNDAITCFIVISPECWLHRLQYVKAKKKPPTVRTQKDAYGLAALPLADSLLNLPRANGNTPLA
jgi:hypothetical protein